MSERLPVQPNPNGQQPVAPAHAPPPAPFRSLADPEEGGGKIQIGRIIAALLRFKWILVLAALLGGGAAVMVYRSIAPIYRAEGQLWVNADSRGGQMAGPIAQSSLLEQGAWIDLLKSYAVLDPVVISEQLYIQTGDANRPLFQGFRLGEKFLPGAYTLRVSEGGDGWTLLMDESRTVDEGLPGDSIGKEMGFLWAPPAAELTPERLVAFRIVHPRDAAAQLASRIQPQIDRQGNFISLTYDGTNPERIATVLESVMLQHVNLAVELKKGKLDELTEILADQLASVQRELESAENQLRSFQIRTVTLPSEQSGAIAPGLQQTQAPVFTDYFNRRLELEAISRDLERLSATLDSIPQGGLRVESFELIPAVSNSSQLRGVLQELTDKRAELRGLLRQYTEDYQPVRDVMGEIRDLETITVPSLTRSLMAELTSRQMELQQVLELRGGELEQIPSRAIEENRLERQVQITSRLYEDLRQRYATAELAAKSSIPDVEILSHTRVPSVPFQDKRISTAGLTFLGFLGAGLLVAFLLDRADPRFRYLSDVSDDLGLEILGVVPRLKSGRKENSTIVFEAFRDIRMRAEFAHGASRPMVLAVTSPDQSEGKTFVCANLAIAFAQLGRATLLIDGDTRRGDLHDLFDVERKPGLTDLLEGRVRSSVIVPSSHENLDILPCGSRRSTSPELLSSGRMQQVLGALKPRYDVIIVDSPPMAAGSDAFVLGAHTGNLILVMRAGSTHKDLAKGKLETFLRLPVRILGGILNDIEERDASFGYYRHYTYYLPEYIPSEDEPAEAGELPGGEGRSTTTVP